MVSDTHVHMVNPGFLTFLAGPPVPLDLFAGQFRGCLSL